MREISGLPAESGRAKVVRGQIESIKSDVASHLLDLGALLSEARQRQYFSQWGYETFPEWLSSSGLDLGERQAYYLMRISDVSQSLGIDRQQLLEVKFSKLKEIFSLNPAHHAEQIKTLVNQAKTLSLDDVRNEVHALNYVGSEEMVWRNFKLLKSAAENVVDVAIQRMKDDHGTVIDTQTGEVIELSHSRCLEMICANYLAEGVPQSDN